MADHPDGPAFLARASEINEFNYALEHYAPPAPALAAPRSAQPHAASQKAFTDHPCTGRSFGPAAPSSSLGPDESNQQTGSESDIEFRHTWWADDRRRIRSALQSIFPGSKRLDRFRSCGDAAWIYQSVKNPNRVKVCSDSCRDRWCRACQRDRSRIIAANLRTRLENLEVKLITLTLRHRDQALRSQVTRLLDCFRTLRRNALWADAIEGGVGFIEVKYNPETDRWHPHLHILCTGAWIRQADLASTWHAITGDSFNVDIRLVRNLDRVAYYVVKYASKPIATVLYRHPRRLREAIDALQGRHLCMTFGTFRGWKLTKQGDGDDWVMLGTLEGFQVRARTGDLHAIDVLDALQRAQHSAPSRDKPP